MLEKIDIVVLFAAKIRRNYNSSKALSQRLILSTCHCTRNTRHTPTFAGGCGNRRHFGDSPHSTASTQGAESQPVNGTVPMTAAQRKWLLERKNIWFEGTVVIA